MLVKNGASKLSHFFLSDKLPKDNLWLSEIIFSE